MVQRQEPAETIDLDLIFLSRELVFQGTISKAKHRRSVFMAGTEYFGATAQPRHHIPEFCLSTPCENPRGGGYSHTVPIRVCAAQRGRDFEAPGLERGIHFRRGF